MEFDEGLVETIRADVLDQPGSLPLLEHALKELWERRQNRRLSLQAYRDIGGVGGAIAQRAEAEYDQLGPEQQAMAQRIFLRLVQLGEGAEDTRRRARLSELLTSPGEAAAVEAVVQELSDARLLTTGRDASSGEKLLDVSHEALIRGWPRLREWLNEDRDALRFHRKLGERAEEWRRLGNDDSGLLRGAQLEQAESWADGHANKMNALERKLIAASTGLRERETERQRRIEEEREAARRRDRRHATRLRRLVVVLAGAVAIALGAAFFAWDRMQVADNQRLEAERQSRIAASRQLAVQRLLCRNAGLWNQTSDWNQASEMALAACDLVIQLTPGTSGAYFDRAIVRALRGETAGALDDIRTSILTDPETFKIWGTDVLHWMQALQAGENPFDAATLEKLRQRQ